MWAQLCATAACVPALVRASSAAERVCQRLEDNISTKKQGVEERGMELIK